MSSGAQGAGTGKSANSSFLGSIYARVGKLDKAGNVAASRIQMKKSDTPSDSSAASSNPSTTPSSSGVAPVKPETMANTRSDTIVID